MICETEFTTAGQKMRKASYGSVRSSGRSGTFMRTRRKMCIRDRWGGYQLQTLVDNGLVEDLTGLWKDYITPVSYTHLDVYKRQLIQSCVWTRML